MEKLLYQLLSVSSHSGQCERMIAFIESLYPEAVKDSAGNLFITKGKAATYPCIVAHMDTVHTLTNGDIVPLEFNGNIAGFDPHTMSQTGIGGDDKCGIWVALTMLHNLPACKVALFVDEETGCQGSRKADLEFFSDCRFILQCDRRNDSWNSKNGINYDFITSICGDDISSKDFKKAVKPYLAKRGYTTCSGMMTDVQELVNRGVGVSCANMSAGYFRPHSSSEYINVFCLNQCIQLVYDICTNMVERFPFKRKKKEYKYNGHVGSGYPTYNASKWEDRWKKNADGSWSPKSETTVNGKEIQTRKTWWEEEMERKRKEEAEENKKLDPWDDNKKEEKSMLPNWWKGKVDNPRLTGPIKDNADTISSVQGPVRDDAPSMTDAEFETYNVM